MSVNELCQAVYQQWLFTDLHEIGQIVLPSCITKANRYVLNGKHCLQVE